MASKPCGTLRWKEIRRQRRDESLEERKTYRKSFPAIFTQWHEVLEDVELSSRGNDGRFLSLNDWIDA